MGAVIYERILTKPEVWCKEKFKTELLLHIQNFFQVLSDLYGRFDKNPVVGAHKWKDSNSYSNKQGEKAFAHV